LVFIGNDCRFHEKISTLSKGVGRSDNKATAKPKTTVCETDITQHTTMKKPANKKRRSFSMITFLNSFIDYFLEVREESYQLLAKYGYNDIE